MRILIAPDSFKGSISAKDVGLAIEDGIRKVIPDADVVHLPLADGGEGTIESMVFALGGSVGEAIVHDPLGREIKASFGVLKDGNTVIIEMAQASGLPLLQEYERNPLITSTVGTGELIRHCLDKGYRHFLLGLGGSATNDAGMGMLKALGVQFLDSGGNNLPEGGASLNKLERIDTSNIDTRLKESSFIAVSDVRNILCGEHGASHIFGPQKGANAQEAALLDQALRRFGDVVNEQLNIDIITLPGSGAAGGIGAAAVAFLQAEIRSGIDLILEYYHFDDRIIGADLLITGEGKLDSQTLSGKVISGVCKKASLYNIPVVALCGSVQLSTSSMDDLGLTACLPIVNGPCRLEEAIANSYEWTRDRAEQMMRLAVLAFPKQQR
ncbi:glycerate kinase [Cohnella sp.]|uniref:glycerate kinase n=1 Tax=Cohnella sp. TaxID=1883426 RepID=UPI003569468E